jgi:hypothetical protein
MFSKSQELEDNTIKDLYCAIKKPGRDAQGFQISKLSTTHLKLYAFWLRHMWRTLRGVENWTEMTWINVKLLANQKTLEDSLLDTKNPETLTILSRTKKSSNQNLLYQEMSTRSGSNLVLRVTINFYSYSCNNA